jgi:hypothetical protein
MTEADTAWLLRQWALWSLEGHPVRLGFKSPMAGMIAPARWRDEDAGRLPQSEIDESLVMIVDGIMGRLKLTSPDFYRVLWLTFARDFGARRVANSFGITRHAAGELYMAAYGYVDGLMQERAMAA